MSFTAETGEVYTLHPESASYLKIRADNATPNYDVLSVEAARSFVTIRGLQFAGDVSYDGTSVELIVPSPDVPDGIPVTVYSPTNKPSRPTILVYFHGGGFVLGTRKEFEATLKTISQKTGCIALNVDYRLAPEHKMPAAVDDGICVTEWVLANREAVGGAADSTVGVGGDSAGGNVAANVCHAVSGLAYQILVYPAVDLRPPGQRPDYKSKREFANGPILEKEVLLWFQKQYLAPNLMDIINKVTPIIKPDFKMLPPAILIMAEIDPLRDEGFAYHEKLKEAGVPSEAHLVKGGIHAYFSMPKHFKELCEDSYNKVAAFIKSHL